MDTTEKWPIDLVALENLLRESLGWCYQPGGEFFFSIRRATPVTRGLCPFFTPNGEGTPVTLEQALQGFLTWYRDNPHQSIVVFFDRDNYEIEIFPYSAEICQQGIDDYYELYDEIYFVED